jgi:hypothetical protein
LAGGGFLMSKGGFALELVSVGFGLAFVFEFVIELEFEFELELEPELVFPLETFPFLGGI